jgi:hypothetical protein
VVARFLGLESRHYLPAPEGPGTAVNGTCRAIGRGARHTNPTRGDEKPNETIEFPLAALKPDQALALLFYLEALRRASGKPDTIGGTPAPVQTALLFRGRASSAQILPGAIPASAPRPLRRILTKTPIKLS